MTLRLGGGELAPIEPFWKSSTMCEGRDLSDGQGDTLVGPVPPVILDLFVDSELLVPAMISKRDPGWIYIDCRGKIAFGLSPSASASICF